MPFPNNALDFIDHRNPHLEPGWEDVFGEYKWFRLRGFNEAITDLQRAVSTRHRTTCDGISQFRLAASNHVPDSLKRILPGARWNEFASPQIRDCQKGHALRFDKACLIAAAIDLYAQQLDSTSNYLRRVRVTPAIYELRGFNDALWSRIKAHSPIGNVEFVDALKGHTAQRLPNFFGELATGYAATYRTLSLTLDFLRTHNMAAGLSIAQLTSRDYPGKSRSMEKRPNKLETVVAID